VNLEPIVENPGTSLSFLNVGISMCEKPVDLVLCSCSCL
jgi:hypothetical protein